VISFFVLDSESKSLDALLRRCHLFNRERCHKLNFLGKAGLTRALIMLTSLFSGLNNLRRRSTKSLRRRCFGLLCGVELLEPRLVFAAIQDWQIRGVGGGGALFSPSFNPANPDEMYIASDMGQVFHTTNEGAVWQTVDHREIHGGHASKVQFTSDPLIRYAVDYTADLQRPTKSTDGGVTWTPMAADPTGGEAYTVVADYNNPNRVLVSSYSRLYISTNGGASFTQRFSTSSGDGLLVGGAFFDGSNIYVGTNQGVLVSTNGGTCFSVASYAVPSGGIVSFAGAKSGGTTRLWAVTGTSAFAGVPGWEHDYAGVYRIDVGQSAWTSITSGLASTATPFIVSAATNDINTVYVGGGNGGLENPTVYRSTTGGGSWQSVLQTTNNANVQTGWAGHNGDRGWSYGELALGFAVSPLNSSRILITDYGFAHYSEDGGASWRSLNVAPDDLNPAGAPTPKNQPYKSSGLENTTSWGLTWTSSSHIVGSFSDIRGAVSHDGGDSWSFNYTGHTENSMYRSIVHPTTGIVYAATSNIHDMYQSTHLTDAAVNGSSDSGDGSVLFSTNGGNTWQVMHDFGNVVMWVEADPTNANRLYAAVAHSTQGGIFVTNNAQAGAGSTWTKLTNPPRTQGHAFNIRVLNDGTLVVTYSGRRDSGGAFTASSGVFVSTDGGQSWADRSHSGMLYWTKDVVIDPHDAAQNTWYATVFSGWGGAPNGLGGLYKTTNRGQTWTRINTLDRVNSITISPTNANEAYLTTEVDGLWHTENLNAASPTFAQVAGYKFMQPLRVVYSPYDANEVWVTSFGGGLRVGYVNLPDTAGDFDGDGDADGADFIVWQTNFPTTSGATPATGDADGDNDVDGADFANWQDNFPANPSSSPASAPSPEVLGPLAAPDMSVGSAKNSKANERVQSDGGQKDNGKQSSVNGGDFQALPMLSQTSPRGDLNRFDQRLSVFRDEGLRSRIDQATIDLLAIENLSWRSTSKLSARKVSTSTVFVANWPTVRMNWTPAAIGLRNN
jgi:hypothetical protein